MHQERVSSVTVLIIECHLRGNHLRLHILTLFSPHLGACLVPSGSTIVVWRRPRPVTHPRDLKGRPRGVGTREVTQVVPRRD